MITKNLINVNGIQQAFIKCWNVIIHMNPEDTAHLYSKGLAVLMDHRRKRFSVVRHTSNRDMRMAIRSAVSQKLYSEQRGISVEAEIIPCDSDINLKRARLIQKHTRLGYKCVDVHDHYSYSESL